MNVFVFNMSIFLQMLLPPPASRHSCDRIIALMGQSSNPVEIAFWIEYFAGEMDRDNLERVETQFYERFPEVSPAQKIQIEKHLSKAEGRIR